MAALTGLEAIEQEMAYTSWADSCQDPLLPTVSDERACRRAKGHPGNLHASGHSANGTLILWSSVTDHPRCNATQQQP